MAAADAHPATDDTPDPHLDAVRVRHEIDVWLGRVNDAVLDLREAIIRLEDDRA